MDLTLHFGIVINYYTSVQNQRSVKIGTADIKFTIIMIKKKKSMSDDRISFEYV